MLINFTIENWLSFREETMFSMVAGRERQHGERLPRVKKYQMRLLPVSAIYGGNASGKTNFFKAMSFAKWFVTNGPQSDADIPFEFFRLAPECKKKPVQFYFELLIDEVIYKYAFAILGQEVVEESLTRMTSSSEVELFSRQGEKITFPQSLAEKDATRFQIIFEGTRTNQLYLTNSVSQRQIAFKTVYDWFQYTLRLVGPDNRFGFGAQLDKPDKLYKEVSNLLACLDTGISKLDEEVISLEKESFLKELPPDILDKVTASTAVVMEDSRDGDSITLLRRDGELIAHRLITFHKQQNGESIKFEMRDESDGSKRAISLLPVFLSLAAEGASHVYFIDELDRSLHTLLARQLLEYYFSSCSPESRSQLVFTTHDLLLMDQELFRRDEMWVAERDKNGASSLYSLSEFEGVRYDKDIRKSYLLGRFGGIPSLYMPLVVKSERHYKKE